MFSTKISLHEFSLPTVEPALTVMPNWLSRTKNATCLVENVAQYIGMGAGGTHKQKCAFINILSTC